MEPTLVDRDAFTVMGVQERFTPETEDFEGIWKRYMAFHDRIAPLSTDGAHYGVCLASDQEGAMDYVAGMAVPAGTPCPAGLVLRDVPAAREAPQGTGQRHSSSFAQHRTGVQEPVPMGDRDDGTSRLDQQPEVRNYSPVEYTP